MGQFCLEHAVEFAPSHLILPRVSAGTVCPHTSRLEHLRERLSHDAAGSGHLGPVRSVDAARYARSWVLLSDTHSVSQLLLESTV